MWMIRNLLLLPALLVMAEGMAQGESLRALTARPTGKGMRAKADVNTHFVYQYQTQEIPLMDDFSIDRTRTLDAHPDDPDVTLDQTIQHLAVAGASEPGMAFATDTTFTYTVDMADPPVTTRAPLPSVMVTVTDLDVWPTTSEEVGAWPPYDVYDTLQSPSPDTLWQSPPDLVQDSLLVYLVAADDGVYQMNGSPTPLVLWADDDAYVNNTFGLDPPTIGVATFDGLARTGYPYNFAQPNSYGLADKLTSVPIDLQYPPGDSIYLSFMYQPMGLSGDMEPQPRDSLVLEFYAPLEDLWVRVWSTPYFLSDEFHNVMVPIIQDRFLKNGFRMRFMNYATLSGAFDHWHLEYVRLAGQRTYDDTVLVDVAYVYPESTLLNTYTSVPFHRFAAAAPANMAASVSLPQRNLDVNDRFITYGMRASLTDGTGPANFTNGTNTSGNANSSFASTHPVNSAPNNFVYDTGISSDFAFWRAKFWTNTTPDINRYNDTATFVQELSNYYAYDDGSAEMAYGLGGAGSKLAYRFDLLGDDSLRAVRMYFSPTANVFDNAQQPYDGSFLLTVWSSIEPEVIQHQNFSFSSPEYRMHGPNKFVEYDLDSAILVQGTIYVGWVQTNDVRMNLGFDRNRDNRTKIHYKTGSTWQNTSFAGSLMMRPVLASEHDPFVGMATPDPVASGMLLYPNPAADAFTVQLQGEAPLRGMVQCLDATGRAVFTGPYDPHTPVPTSALAPGLYLVRLVDTGGQVLGSSRLVVQR